jgi:hypothetical protein
MATITGALVPLARTSEVVLRRAFSGRRSVRLLTARVIGPCLTAVERFLDRRADAFSERSWQ